MAFVCAATPTQPHFNRLTLFVAQPSASSRSANGQTHAVLPVTQPNANRFALSGWFTDASRTRATDHVALGNQIVSPLGTTVVTHNSFLSNTVAR